MAEELQSHNDRPTFPALSSGIARRDPAAAIELIQGREAQESELFFHSATNSLDHDGLPSLTAALLEHPETQFRNGGLRMIAAALGEAARLDEATALLEATSAALPSGEQDTVALTFIRKVRIEEVENRAELAGWLVTTAPEAIGRKRCAGSSGNGLG